MCNQIRFENPSSLHIWIMDIGIIIDNLSQ
jgi:hypothetical protein